jgi:hypothetical protein
MSDGLYEVEDWTDFRNLVGLGRRAGVSVPDIPRVVVKELVDNAYDTGARCEFEKTAGSTILVRDDGPGISGGPEAVADLFSVRRSRKSSKVIRLPTRGKLGNGLRVVAGAVLATGGKLVVRTRDRQIGQGREIELRPREDGTTEVISVKKWRGSGTQVEVGFGRPLHDLNPDEVFAYAIVARYLAGRGQEYTGKSSPWWYDADSFWELMQAAGDRIVREEIAKLDGCGRQKAGDIARDFHGRTAASLTRAEAERLLTSARRFSKQFNPARLGSVGTLDQYKGYSRVVTGVFRVTPAHGGPGGVIPYVVEAWASEEELPEIVLCVNRTAVTSVVSLYRHPSDKSSYIIHGCGLAHRFPVSRNHNYLLVVNVQCPHVALTSEGKAPDLSPLVHDILDAAEKACRRGRKSRSASDSGGGPRTFKDAVKMVLDDAIAYVSDDHKIRYGQRHLFYRVRDKVKEIAPGLPELEWKGFCRIVAEIEDERDDDLPGMYRDYRGVLYHPHRHEDIPLGTLSVEQYERPEWTFNKVIFIEKDSFFQTLKEDGFPERYDCALITSKGQSTRAVKDVLGLLAESDEPVLVGLVHDADGYGTLIYDKTQNATIARSGRKVRIVNFGLEAKEAIDMKLRPEPVERKNNKKVPVADYVEEEWVEWYQHHRIELDALTPRQFLAWIEGKMKLHGFADKLVPPAEVQKKELIEKLIEKVEEDIKEEILAEARYPDRVEGALGNLEKDIGPTIKNLDETIREALKEEPEESWRDPIEREVDELAARRDADDEQET